MLIYLIKLEHYGTSGVANDVFKSWSVGWTQYVYFNWIKSYNFLTIVFLQSSVLAQQLFLIYINDLENSIFVYDFIRCADNITLFCNIDLIAEANWHIVLNTELENISCLLTSNKLSLILVKRKI